MNLITNKVTLIDFGSGDFIQENFYTTYDGTQYTVNSASCILVSWYPDTSLLRLQYSALGNIKVWRLELGLKFIFT